MSDGSLFDLSAFGGNADEPKPDNVIDLQAYRERKHPQEYTRNIFDAAGDPYTEQCPQCRAQMTGYFIGRKNRWIACDPCGIAQPANDHGWHGLLDMANEAGGDPGEWLEQHYQESREYLKAYGVIGADNA